MLAAPPSPLPIDSRTEELASIQTAPLPREPRTPPNPDRTLEPPESSDSGVTRGVGYVTDDPSWLTKMLVGGLIISFPLLEAICDGYQIRTINNIRAGKRRPLPRWEDFGGLFITGLKLRLVIYTMYLPTIALSILAAIVSLAWIATLFVKDGDTREKISVLRQVCQWVLIPLLDLFVVALQAALFLTVPALARRAADGVSFIRLFNLLPAVRMILANFSLYLTARLTIFILLLAFGFVVGVVSGIGWVIVVGPVVGGWILGVGRFWGRLTWAYYLARMKCSGQKFVAGDS